MFRWFKRKKKTEDLVSKETLEIKSENLEETSEEKLQLNFENGINFQRTENGETQNIEEELKSSSDKDEIACSSDLILEKTPEQLLELELKEKENLRQTIKKETDIFEVLTKDEHLIKLEKEQQESELQLENTEQELKELEFKEQKKFLKNVEIFGDLNEELISEKTEDLESFDEEDTFEAEEDNEDNEKGFFNKLKSKLALTRSKITGRVEALLSSVREIDEYVLDELEEILITSDLGAKTTSDLLFKIRGQVKKNELTDSAALKKALKSRIVEMLNVPVKQMPEVKPLVIMVVGVNGVGKTTTIAKLARRYIEDGKKVLLAAGDTFRAAAVEQLHHWANRIGADIVSQPTGADASAVVYDALIAAKARNVDIVIIDTAGRLHTKVNLMDELKKIRRVADKALPGSPHETILVVDGNTGQNALKQAEIFNKTVKIDSVILTKLDGTAKGGVIVSIANELKIPITNIGIGESYKDLRPFNAQDFADVIFDD